MQCETAVKDCCKKKEPDSEESENKDFVPPPQPFAPAPNTVIINNNVGFQQPQQQVRNGEHKEPII